MKTSIPDPAPLRGVLRFCALHRRAQLLDEAVRRGSNASWRSIFRPGMLPEEDWLEELARCPWTLSRIRAEFAKLSGP